MNTASASASAFAPVARLDADARATFLARTYAHLFGAILAFTGLEIVLFQTGVARSIASFAFQTNWLVILGAFMIVSWIARGAAWRSRSLAGQYAALAAYVVAEALIFVPLLYLANYYADGMIESAAVVTLGGFAGLTFVVFWTRRDFSFLRAALAFGGVAALVLIVAGVLFGFRLGTFFSVAMVALASCAILFDTSKVLHHHPEDRYVAASLELFASVALLFWYVLRIFLGSRR